MCCPQIFERLHLEKGFPYCFGLSSYRGYVRIRDELSQKGRKGVRPLFRNL